MELEDKDIIKHHVHHTHQDAHDARYPHVSTALEHGSRQIGQLEEWHDQHENHEVEGGVGSNVGTSTQPERQLTGDAQSDDGDNDAEKEGAEQTMPEHLTSLAEVIGTDEMRHLHGETH